MQVSIRRLRRSHLLVPSVLLVAALVVAGVAAVRELRTPEQVGAATPFGDILLEEPRGWTVLSEAQRQLLAVARRQRLGASAVRLDNTGGLSEELLFDELDFYHHPAYFTDTYPRFVPERVRRHGAFYYFRHAAAGDAGAFSGSRYGEVSLRGSAGKVQYLPRMVSDQNMQAIRFAYRKSDPGAIATIALFTDRHHYRIAREGETPGFPRHEDTAWHVVTVPMAEMRNAVVDPESADAGASSQQQLPAHYDPRDGYVYAVELGIENSGAADSLFFDRLAILRTTPPNRILKGRVEPPIGGLKIHVNTTTTSHTLTTDDGGEFSLNLPDDATRCEVYTRYRGRWFCPRAGRYMELSTCVPPIVLDLDLEPNREFVTSEGWIRYVTSREYGTAYPANEYFLQGNNYPDKPQEFSIEVATNTYGYFDRDRREDNLDEALRIVIIGECYHCGILIGMQEHFGVQAEAMLNFYDAPPVEIITLGSPGTCLTAGGSVFKNLALRLDPDLILFSFISASAYPSYVHRDLSLKWFGYDPEHPGHPTYDFDPDTGQLREYPADSDYAAYMGPSTPGETIYKRLNIQEFQLEEFDKFASPEAKHVRRVLCAFFKQMSELARARGARVGLFYSAQSGTIDHAKYKLNGHACDTANGIAFLYGIGAEAGISTYNVTAPIVTHAKDADGNYLQIWPIAGHFSPAGNRFLAEGLIQEVVLPEILRRCSENEAESLGRVADRER